VLFAFCVIALAVMFRGSAVGLSRIFMMLGCFIVFVASHWIPLLSVKGDRGKPLPRSFGSEGGRLLRISDSEGYRIGALP
jgi:hypothetical protein